MAKCETAKWIITSCLYTSSSLFGLEAQNGKMKDIGLVGLYSMGTCRLVEFSVRGMAPKILDIQESHKPFVNVV